MISQNQKQHIRSLIKQKPVGSLDVHMILKPHKLKDQIIKMVVNRNVVHKNLMLIGTTHGHYKTYDQKEILELKKEKKRSLKRLIRDNYLVGTPTQSVFILKNIGKILQLYNKTPNIVDHLNDEQIELICRKSYYRLKENRLQGRIGKTNQDFEVLIERLDDLINEFKDRIVYVTVKTTHGRPYTL